MSQRRILVVDDEPSVLKTVRAYLEKEGCSVDTAADGAAALKPAPEVFVNLGKAGSDLAADAEAIGRLISLVLRLPDPISADKRLLMVVEEFQGVGGSRIHHIGDDQVRSLPDGVAAGLRRDLHSRGA